MKKAGSIFSVPWELGIAGKLGFRILPSPCGKHNQPHFRPELLPYQENALDLPAEGLAQVKDVNPTRAVRAVLVFPIPLVGFAQLPYQVLRINRSNMLSRTIEDIQAVVAGKYAVLHLDGHRPV